VNLGSSEVVHRYPMPWWYWLLLVPVATWALVFFGLVQEWRRWAWAWGGQPPAILVQMALHGTVCLAAVAWALARRRAMETSAWVRLDGDGITVSDW